MALARGTSTQGQGADDFTFSHTVTAGSNLALRLTCGIEANNRNLTATYNAVAMTQVNAVNHSVSQSQIREFVMVNPPPGAHDVALDISAADDIVCIATNYSGVDQVTPTAGHEETEFSAATSSALSVTCAAGNFAVDAIAAISGANFGADGENTEHEEFDATAFTLALSEDTTADGTVNMSWAFTTETGTHLAYCLNAAATVSVVPGSVIWFR